MGRLLHFPFPVLSDPPPDPEYWADRPPLARADLKGVLAQPLQGDPRLGTVVRRPFAGQTFTFASPIDDSVEFTFKRATTREHLARQNMSSTQRYITETKGNEERYVQERDVPIGDLKLETILLVLCGWNLTDENGANIAINHRTVQQYLEPKEFEFCFEKAMEVNPMWSGRGEDEAKND